MYHKPLFYLFGIESMPVWAYGLCMALGLIGCFAFLMFAFEKKNFNDEAIYKILLIGAFAAAFGIFMAMVFQSVYNYIENPAAGFKLDSSMTFQGGLIGGVSSFLIVWNLYIFVIAPRVQKPKLLQNHMNAGLCDALPIIPIGITIAHALGRLGCTFAGCCHGSRTDAWYGMYMWATGYGEYAKVVPTQLFECIFLVVLTVVMAVLFFKFKFNCNFGVYAIAYGIWRFLIEFARDDHRGDFIAGMTPSQFWSIVMVVLGIAYFFAYKYLFKRFMKHPELQPPVRNKKDGDGAVGEAVTAEPAENAMPAANAETATPATEKTE